MALENSLNFNFPATAQAAIEAAFDAVLLALNDPTVPYVNLTRDERKAPSIGAARMPYVSNAVVNIVPDFPHLASLSIPLARTTTLFELAAFIQSLQPKMDEINDRFTDLGINAEYLVYKSMTDSYETAQRQEGRVPGADVLRAAIAPLFAGQGSNAERPAPDGPDDSGSSSDPAPATPPVP